MTSKGNLTQSANNVFDSGVYNVIGNYDAPYNYGVLLVLESNKESTSAYLVQVFFERKTPSPKLYWRTGNRTGGYYENWAILAS